MKKPAITCLAILISAFILWGAPEAIAQQHGLTVEQEDEESGVLELAAGDPQISVTTFLDFGKVKVKKRKTQKLTIGNTGTGNLIGTVGFSSGGGAFTTSGMTFNLNPTRKKAVRVQFKPSEVGVQQATLEVASNDPSLPVAFVVLQGEGVCDQDQPSIGDWELRISFEYLLVEPVGTSSFSGAGTIPLEIHTCSKAQGGVQAVGSGSIGFTVHSTALACQGNGTFPQSVIISPGPLEMGVGTASTLFIEVDLPTTFYQYQLCCDLPPPVGGCRPIDAEFTEIDFLTEIAFADGETVTIPISRVGNAAGNITFTLFETLPPLPSP